VQKSDTSFKRKKGRYFIFLFNYVLLMVLEVSKTGIFKIAAGGVFEKMAHSCIF
jgi:hypothetical protein